MKYRSRNLDIVKGLIQVAPVTSVFLFGGVFALVGVPPFNIFLSKFLIISAGIATGHFWLMIICMLLLMLAFAALFKMLSSVVLGEKPAEIRKGEMGFTTLAPIAVLMILVLILGVYMPAPLSVLLNDATGVVNAGMTVVQPNSSGLAIDSILGSVDPSQAQPFFTLFRVQAGK